MLYQILGVGIILLFREAYYSLARMALISLDLVTLIKTGLDHQVYQPLIDSAAVNELHNGGCNLLYQLAESFLGDSNPQQPASEAAWRQRYFDAISLFQKHGIETVSDLQAGADNYVALRRDWNSIVMTFAKYMDYRWSEITPNRA